ncbi:hypothetical protein RG959_10160 [Domibacillus sp. 8LH]
MQQTLHEYHLGEAGMKQKWWQKEVIYQIYPKSFYDSNNDGIGVRP